VNDIEVRAHRPRRKDGLMDRFTRHPHKAGVSGFLAMFDGPLAVDGTNEPSASVDVGGAHIFGFRCAR